MSLKIGQYYFEYLLFHGIMPINKRKVLIPTFILLEPKHSFSNINYFFLPVSSNSHSPSFLFIYPSWLLLSCNKINVSSMLDQVVFRNKSGIYLFYKVLKLMVQLTGRKTTVIHIFLCKQHHPKGIMQLWLLQGFSFFPQA